VTAPQPRAVACLALLGIRRAAVVPGASRHVAPGGDGRIGDCFDEQTVLDLLAGELPDQQLASAERHLAACEACADLLGAMAPLLPACLCPTHS
jgi:hypothetical protein